MTMQEMREKLVAKYGAKHEKVARFDRICKRNPNGGWLVRHLFNVLMED